MYAFCHLRKTGGVTFTQILRREFGLRHLDAITRYPGGELVYRNSDFRIDRMIYGSPKSIAGHGVRPFLNLDLGEPLQWLTIFRDPVQRYASHFIHHVDHHGYAGSFETWMEIEKHQNDQTKTIAGTADLPLAKEWLAKFFWVGFTEEFDLSMRMLEARIGNGFSGAADKKSNVARGLSFKRQELVDRYEADIVKRNLLDIELYRFAQDSLWKQQLEWLDPDAPSPQPGNTRQLRRWANLVKRNLIYKPFVKLTNPFRN